MPIAGIIAGMFRLDGVSKTYDGKTVLDAVDLATPPGRTTALLGPSGCGKSTVLGLMTGLLRPDGGTVLFEDRPLTADRLTAVRRRIGYVIQDGGLFPHLTNLANVTLAARHIGWPTDRVRRRVEELTGFVRLPAHSLSRYPTELSGGQRQRVSLMRALMLDPEVLLLDEPFAALDPMVRAELQTELAEVFRRLGKTVVLVTHDVNEAAYFADRVVLLRDGRVVQAGTVDDLFDRPADPFVGQFLRAQQGRTRVRQPA